MCTGQKVLAVESATTNRNPMIFVVLPSLLVRLGMFKAVIITFHIKCVLPAPATNHHYPYLTTMARAHMRGYLRI
jgi:hypothetical protein